ncbi:hypothetical protein PLICRDRAFT_168536 [Plicaturopsis crispa FD-325 SS-3]|uniref:BTB domain-containing protein n=1 Tax=Plicaturopsis crispa FD-325 SS-3 TaxID=944288 RepID=A0A0C9T763_PLICR|nr:hypothetical protein PLICRDRAFT_168536 [Plicaturopsis crispa FD-325 SS-3]
MASSGPSTRPPKRTRTDASDDEQPPILNATNSSTVWYQDGSIVLQAANTRFRVHHTILAQNSPIFEDMLSIGESRGEESVEDCPLVLLHDSAEDLESVLRALYDRRYFDTDKMQPFRVVASILRVSKKYEIQHLYEKALKCLTDELPNTLKGYDTNDVPRIFSYDGFHFDVVNLARELDIQSILPVAFYYCIEHYRIAQILDGIPCRATGKVKKLSPHDQKVAIIGMQYATEWYTHTAFMWMDRKVSLGATQCRDPDVCGELFQKASDHIRDDLPLCSPLFAWNSKWDSVLCDECLVHARKEHDSRRSKFWAELPDTFGLAGWKRI